MGSTIQEYLASLRGKRVAVLGIGVSNTPLIKMLLRADVEVTACDKRQREDFGGQAEELESLGAELRLGPDYLDGLLREFRQSNFVVYLQPLYGVEQGAVIGAEALVRKIDEEGNVHAPFEFVHMMEEENLISVVDYEMLEQSCRLLKEVGEHWPGFQLSCNMSRNTLAELDYLDRIDDILTRTGVDHSQLIFEVTESSRGLQLESIEDRLNALKARGIAVAVDDMGTECSCLEMLYLPQLDLVKIDRSLISKTGHGPREQAVIGSLIDLCHKLGLGCIAEGIETKEQGELLKSLGCDRLQGYYFGRPMPPQEFFAQFGPGAQEHQT